MIKLDYLKWTFILFLLISVNISCKRKGIIEVISKNINSSDEIVSLTDSLVLPYDYLSTVALDDLPVEEKKQKFIDLVVPAILVARHNLEQDQEKSNKLISKDTSRLKNRDKQFLETILEKYRADDFDDLNSKLQTHPNSIVIAQAAIESGWGTSRFYVEANNIFGIWTYNPDIPSIQALGQRSGKTIYLKKYLSVSESIDSYFLTIALGPYKEFRRERLLTNDPYRLITFLTSYSEKRLEYVEQIRTIIKKNDLTKYDNYIIDPDFIK